MSPDSLLMPSLAHFLPHTLRTACKINVYLRITACLPNGYHTLDTVFVPLSEPFDTLSFVSAPQGQGLRVLCNVPTVNIHDNTLTRAYAAYAAASGFAPDITLNVQKNVPIGAGLGGGSANAAGLLQFLQTHAPRPLSAEALDLVALSVGADVPFFLRNIPCHATGIGDLLNPVDLVLATGLALPWHGVLIMPKLHVSTSWAYGAWDSYNKNILKKDTDLTNTAQENRPQILNVPWLENSFEAPVFLKYPELLFLKGMLLRAGARLALLSGSGSSLFGVFHSNQEAHAMYECMLKKGIDVVSFCIV